MDVRALHGRQLFAAVVFVAATIVLAVQLITPSPVMVSVGDNGTKVAELGGYFRYSDVGVITVAAALLGASGTYLLLGGRARPDGGTSARTPVDEPATVPESSDELLEMRREEWDETADQLVNNERQIYEIVLDADGVLAQNEIVEQTDLSKATVSRTLDNLESKNLVERKRRGMGNVVMLL